MKKTIWIFSLSALLFTTLAPSFTYATWEVADEPIIEPLILETLDQELLWSSSDDLWDNNSIDNIVDDPLDYSWNNDLLDVDFSNDLNTSDIQKVLSQSNDDLNLSTVSWKDCYDYNYNNGTLILNKYLCDDTNIIIPTSESWSGNTTSIQDWAFAWKLIEKLEMPDQFTVGSEAFSWAVFSWNIILEEKKSWQYFNDLYSIIVAEWATLTLKQANRLYMSTVNWKLVYDLNNVSGVSYLLNKWTINWEVEIKWLNWTLSYSFESCNITENAKIILWEWITHISSYSFGWDYIENVPSIMNWIIKFPSTLISISNSFNNTEINTDFEFLNPSISMNNSFKESVINSDIELVSSNGIWQCDIRDSFENSVIWWDVLFSGLDLSIYGFSPVWISWSLSFVNIDFSTVYNIMKYWNSVISWNVNFLNSDVVLQWGFFFQATKILWDFNMSWENIIAPTNMSDVPIALKIWWNLNITWVNVLYPRFSNSQITWDLNIYWDTMNVQYSLLNTSVGWNVSIIGNTISGSYWSLNWMNIGGNFLMSWNDISFISSVLNWLHVDWNFEIKASILKAQYYVLNSLNVLWDLNLPNNSVFWDGVLWGVISKWSKIVSNEAKISIWDSVENQQLNSSVEIVVNEVDDNDIFSNTNWIVVQNSEIVATSWMVVEYEWWLNINFKDNSSSDIEWTARFSAPIAVKVPVKNVNNNFVKVMVKHKWDEDFWFTGLTLSQENVCEDWLPKNSPYSWEDIAVEVNNGERYAVIYTCSASTFVAYTENEKKNDNNENNSNSNVSNNTTSSYAWGGSAIIVKPNNLVKEQEHNSADLDETSKQENYNTTSQTNNTPSIGEQVKKIEWRSLTRWEVAVMTNILLDVYPQLTEKRELNEVSEACEKYSDEQNFTKDEKKAITRLCKLSIMGIHNDDNKPLDKFMVNEITKNDEFSKVINRSLSTYTEKDFSVVKDALKKLEWDEDNVVFGTVYDIFMSIKNIFG